MSFEALKEQVLHANLKLPAYGLVELTWGNVSAIDESRRYVAIKPSGVSYENMQASDIVVVDMDGNLVEGCLRPSSDLLTHLEIYKHFPKVCGVVHTHSKFATAFAQAKRPVTALGTTHADCFYGDIPLTRELTREEIERDYEKNTGSVIVETYEKLDYEALPAVLVACHGLFAWGNSPASAVEHAFVAEKSAEMAYMTITLGGTERVAQYLLDKHYYRKHGANAYYGQN
ncbi:MAG: L-ribulose-5-phosphate 4-epimerase AraD [Ruminococcaceae bacterium]|nr:L-ribulose-5-phosphate 4-epimerase AraD [Oscillospiraceae bacterium]